jgi:hypothetical protein
VPGDGKYPLTTSLVPPDVSIERDILGKVVSCNIVDHDITDEHTFVEPAKEK